MLGKKVTNDKLVSFLRSIPEDQEREVHLYVSENKVSAKFINAYLEILFQKYEFTYIIKHLLFILDNYGVPTVINVQKKIIKMISDLFFTEEYFEVVALLYQKMLQINDKTVSILSEHIFELLIRCGKILDKNIVIGNI